MTFQLEEVTIHGNGGGQNLSANVSDLALTGWNVMLNEALSLTAGGMGGGGGGGGGTGTGDTGWVPNQQNKIASGSPHTSLWDIVNLMATSLGSAASYADFGASVMKLETAAAFSTTSTVFGYFDIFSNTLEFIQDPNLEDLGQIAVGVLIVSGYANPITAVGLGIALSAWEIYEYKRDH